MRLYQRDVFNIGILLLMLCVLGTSLFYSDYYPEQGLFSQLSLPRFSLTGLTVYSDTPLYFSANHLYSKSQPYVGDTITFYATLLDNLNPVSSASCFVAIPAVNLSMIYDEALAQYSAQYVVAASGVIDYEISCWYDSTNSSGSKLQLLSSPTPFTYQGKLFALENNPNIGVSLAVNPGVVGMPVTVLVTLTNNDALYSGPVILHLNLSGEYESSVKTIELSSSQLVAEFNATYSSSGQYIVQAFIEPVANEITLDNNFASKNVSITQPEQSLCGAITTSTTLKTNSYCPEGLFFNAENITLDCNGFRVYGDGLHSLSTGISVSKNSIVKNCSVADYGLGISLSENSVAQYVTVTDSNTGVQFAGSNSVTSYSTLSSNLVAFHSLNNSKISYTDFNTNSAYGIIENSSVVDVSLNYWGTRNYSVISKLITNSSPYNLTSVLTSSFLNSSRKVVLPTYGNLSVATEISVVSNSTSIILKTIATTNLAATCTISPTWVSGYDWRTMTTSSNMVYTYEQTFSDDREVSYFISCQTESEELQVTTAPVTFTIELFSLIEDTQKQKEELIVDLNATNFSLIEDKNSYSSETNLELRTIISKRIKTLEIELEYYSSSLNSTNQYLILLSNLSKNVSLYDLDLIAKQSKKISETTNAIASLNKRFIDSIDTQSKSLREIVQSLKNEIMDRHNSKLARVSSLVTRNDFINDYIVPELVLQRDLLIFEKKKVQKLSDISNVSSYATYLTRIDANILRLSTSIDERTRDEALSDIIAGLDSIDESILVYETTLDDLSSLKDSITDAIDVADSIDSYSDVQSLSTLDSEVDFLIDDFDNKIKALEQDRIKKNIQYSDYKKRSSSQYEETTAYRRERTTWPVSSLNTPLLIIPSSKNLLSSVTVTSSNPSSQLSYIDLFLYKQMYIPEPTGLDTLGRYLFTPSMNLSLQSYTFIFDTTSVPVISNNYSGYVLYGYSDSWNKLADSRPMPTLIFSNVTSQYSYFILTYNLTAFSSPCNLFTNCTGFSTCDINGNKTRKCYDISRCSDEFIVENASCEYIPPHCFDKEMNDDETDIDCGGSCLINCTLPPEIIPEVTPPVEPDPSSLENSVSIGTESTPNLSIESPEQTKSTNYFLVVLYVLITAVLAFGFYFAVIKNGLLSKLLQKSLFEKLNIHTDQSALKDQKYNQSSTVSSAHGKKIAHGMFDHTLIDRLIHLELQNYDHQTIINTLVKGGFKEEHVAYYLSLTVYCIEQIHAGAAARDLVDYLTKNKWHHTVAQSIIDFIIASYLYNYIILYSKTNPHEDLSVLVEMFKLNGYDEGLIENAFDAFNKKDIKALFGNYAGKQSIEVSSTPVVTVGEIAQAFPQGVENTNFVNAASAEVTVSNGAVASDTSVSSSPKK